MTLIELLVTIGVIGLLLAVLLPAVQSARGSARRMQCQNRIRQISLACHAHEDTFAKLPAGTSLEPGSSYLSWCTQILPFLEQDAWFDEVQASLNRSPDVFSAADHPLFQSANPRFSCPSDGRLRRPGISENTGTLAGLLSYQGCNGINHERQDGVLFGGSAIAWNEVVDGLSNTILLGERPPSPANDYGWWYAGVGLGDGTLDHTLGVREKGFSIYLDSDSNCSDNYYRPGDLFDECSASHYWSLHPGGANFAMCDGSVRFIAYADAKILGRMATRHGGD